MKLRRLLLTVLFAAPLCALVQGQTFTFGTNHRPDGLTFEVDSRGFMLGGRHVLPVMGEIHYARVPAKDWRREVRKMKAGGITMLATYCFWIHHEQEEGRWDWSGNRDLHRFLQICKEEGMPVVLRIGPFCHGEVYQGGMPEWIVRKATADPKQYRLRSEAPGFMAAVQRLYSNIFAQASDMLWKHGGPVVGIQLENECRGPWSYYMALKRMAVAVGFDVPFYTRTGWPKLNGKEEFGQMLPLYGDYADGFWDRELTDMPGEYPQAFVMKDKRLSAVIATETFGTNQDTRMEANDRQYPYLTCELGGGMMASYHRRINISGNEAMPLAVCKLGSGSNLPGYYMYHGGTNPAWNSAFEPRTLGETQASPVTNYNDMPYMTYDFQCPLGEMGQPNLNAFHQTRLLHQFLADWGEELSQMDVDTLSEHYARRGCFEFFNDYVRILHEEGRAYVRPVGMPFRGHSVTADAQPFCQTGDTLWLVEIKGMRPTVTVDGKRYNLKLDKPFTLIIDPKTLNLKPQTSKPSPPSGGFRGLTLCILSQARATTAFKIDGSLHFAPRAGAILYKDGERIVEEYWHEDGQIKATAEKRQEAGAPREVPMGSQKAAAMPTNKDFEQAAVWSLRFTAEEHPAVKNNALMTLDAHPTALDQPDDYFAQIDYAGDCARLYADGRLVADNFWNGNPMLARFSDLVGAQHIELRILPLRKDAPIYLQAAQRAVLDAAEGDALLRLDGVKVLHRATEPGK